jgi:hypothetical protein
MDYGGGFMVFDFRRTLGENTTESDVLEYRPYQIVSWKHRVSPRMKTSVRFKVEQRIQQEVIDDRPVGSYRFSFRFRLRASLAYRLSQSEELSAFYLDMDEEPMVNAGKYILRNVFDQNRLRLILRWQLKKNLAVSAGYINWLFFPESGDGIDVRHTGLVTVAHSIR